MDMKKPNGHFHGSDIEKIEAAYGIKKEEIINFSGNVNPLGVSDTLRQYLPGKIDLIATYPDRDYVSLRETISGYVGTQMAWVAVGNGSSELISLCIKTKKPKHALIIGPTYSEYEREILIEGGTCTYVPLLEEEGFTFNMSHFKESVTADMDFMVICNPNNPTSSYMAPDVIREVLGFCRSRQIMVMVDETYIEFVEAPNASSILLVPDFDNLFVIRGVSKFFAAPGLRLGYAVCSNEIFMKKLEAIKNPWGINSLAAYSGELLLTDLNYIEKSKALMNRERARMIEAIGQIPHLQAFTPYANFMLVRISEDNPKKLSATALFETLIEKKMMIRDASSFNLLHGAYFRFCFLLPEQNDMLIAALKELFTN